MIPQLYLVTSYKDGYAETLFTARNKPVINYDCSTCCPNSVVFLPANNSDCLKIYNKPSSKNTSTATVHQ